jgi:antitoxin component HigA of HigAB toxin-antitoxin module
LADLNLGIDLLDTLSVLLETYEDTHYLVDEVTGLEVLRFLMDEHQLTRPICLNWAINKLRQNCWLVSVN